MTITFNEIYQPIYTLDKAETEELEQTHFVIASEGSITICVTKLTIDDVDTYSVWSPLDCGTDYSNIRFTY